MTKIKIRVIPNAPKTKVDGAYGDAVKIRLQAPPVDGKANTELIKFISKQYDIPRTAIKILSGETSRDKIIGIDGYELDLLNPKK